MTQLVISSLNKGINAYFVFLKTLLLRINIPVSYVSIPRRIKRITLIKSPHINKSAREQFQLSIYKKVFYFNQELSCEIFKFILLNKPKFIKVIVRKIV